MRMYDIIVKKRNGGALTEEEIRFFVKGYTEGSIPDYQASALMMAIYFQGMNEKETAALTMEMARSGDMLDLSAINGIKADKHSTGGVGDKTSLVLTPLCASIGIPVAKMSGRGLGHTGGTIDKLESFPGFTTELSEEAFIRNVNTIGIAIAGQTKNMTPADKKLYALRDVTGTVDSIPLIASSIMCKKIAAGADVIVLDVKTGSGAFMKTEEDSLRLAKEMVRIGRNVGRNTMAVISDMDEPLGYAVGNAIEVKEAIDTLNGRGPEDLLELCLTIGSLMAVGTKMAADTREARELLLTKLKDGSALKKFAQFVKAQGGDPAPVFDTSLLPKASLMEEITAEQDGYVAHIESDHVGISAMKLGGGRETKDSPIDLSVGILLKKKVGDHVTEGETVAVMYANDAARLQAAKEEFAGTYTYAGTPVTKPALIRRIIQ